MEVVSRPYHTPENSKCATRSYIDAYLTVFKWVVDLDSLYFSLRRRVRRPTQGNARVVLTYALAFRSAHRAFIIADNFFRMAALIGLRPVVFLEAGVAFFGADLPFRFAQRCFIAAEIRLRAAGLMR